jgi:hypothetical protein
MNGNPGLEEMFLVTEVISGVCLARELVQFSRWKNTTAELPMSVVSATEILRSA